MLGFGTMRQLHDMRHGRAVMKNLQQQIISTEGEEDVPQETKDGVNIDVLDIMESLKDQFENLQEKYKNYRQGKAKYRTGKLATDIHNNKSIMDFLSPRRKQQQANNLAYEEENDEGVIQEESGESSSGEVDLQLLFSDSEQAETYHDRVQLEELKLEAVAEEQS